MSQPTSGGAPEGAPGYSQPQDPWAGGYEPGLASMPTDPIPQQYEQPYAVRPELWSQATAGPAGPPQPPYGPPAGKRSNAAMIVGVILLVLVLGGGGGFAAYKYLTRNTAPTPTPSTSPSASGPSDTLTTPTTFPYTVQTGDCMVNNGTAAAPAMGPASCSTPGSYKVVKRVMGADIPEGPDGKFDRDTTSVKECAGTGFQTWYGYQAGDDRLDIFFCMTNNP
jgi:hypothetical protein